jgi:signal transduction histidine kinase
LLGLTLFDLLPESSHKGAEEGMEKYFIQASGHRRKNGTVFPVEVSSSELVLEGKNVLILSVRDVTRTKMIADALKLTNVRLNLLLGITRHDILNKLTALLISNEMLSSRLADTGDLEILKLQEKAIQEIKNHIDFTREYDNLGLKGPFWQPVEKMVRRSFAQFLQTISFRCEIHNLEIYVDPLMEKVFYNLFDNAFRYGEGISEISVSCLRKGNDLSILFKDDGIGVPGGEKERIFERGYGKNTGLGLFFTREILSITGMEIHETGEYLNGAQFEIRIPAGHYRFTDSARESCDCHETAEAVVKTN